MDDKICCTCCPDDGSWEIKTMIKSIDEIQKYIDLIKDLTKDDPQKCLKDFNTLARVRYYYSMIENIAGGCNTQSTYLEENLIRYELLDKNNTDD